MSLFGMLLSSKAIPINFDTVNAKYSDNEAADFAMVEPFSFAMPFLKYAVRATSNTMSTM